MLLGDRNANTSAHAATALAPNHTGNRSGSVQPTLHHSNPSATRPARPTASTTKRFRVSTAYGPGDANRYASRTPMSISAARTSVR